MIACDTEPRGNRFQNLTGRRFGRLVVLERTGKRVADGCLCWLCRCDCGNLTVTSSNKLLQGRTMSCGCYRKERLDNSRSYVGGTCVEVVRSKKIPVSNTSGVKNVSRSRGLWMGKITFAHRHFFLGRYPDINTATAIVKAAEAIRDEVVDQIDQLQDRAVDVLAERIAVLLKEFRSAKPAVMPLNCSAGAEPPGGRPRKEPSPAADGIACAPAGAKTKYADISESVS